MSFVEYAYGHCEWEIRRRGEFGKLGRKRDDGKGSNGVGRRRKSGEFKKKAGGERGVAVRPGALRTRARRAEAWEGRKMETEGGVAMGSRVCRGLDMLCELHKSVRIPLDDERGSAASEARRCACLA
eukprot:2325911-Rhodomonas_salina.3